MGIKYETILPNAEVFYQGRGHRQTDDIKCDQLDEMLELTKEMAEKTVSEIGCIKYELLQDVNDRKTMLILEEWKNEDAFSAHMASKHFQRLAALMNARREKPSEVSICNKLF